MKYYIIAGEASGDLHASRLMRELRRHDPGAQFRFIGGDLMEAEGGERVRHFRELAYMGFVPVLLHLRTILRSMASCKRDIEQWQPDAVILVDYPGFNLSIARYVKQRDIAPVFYYISPKIWAWKEYRIKAIKRDVSEMFCILPFEKDFYEGKHGFPIHYVGNPTADEVAAFDPAAATLLPDFGRPVIAVLAGSRKQEIKDNLPDMLRAAAAFGDYQVVVAGAPSVETEFYEPFLAGTGAKIVHGQTYQLLASATAALVTSGTATLETALFRVPQVVCYEMPLPRLTAFLRRRVIKVPFISLVNLIAGREVVPELVADTFSVDNMRSALGRLLPGGDGREEMLRGYEEVAKRLGEPGAPANAARLMVSILRGESE